MTVNLGQQIHPGTFRNRWRCSPQADWLKLELIKAEGSVEPEGYIWADAEGRGSVQNTFTWLPECNIFTNDVYQNDYAFTFRVMDDKCFNKKGDTLVVNITIKDLDGEDSEFLPPNLFHRMAMVKMIFLPW